MLTRSLFDITMIIEDVYQKKRKCGGNIKKKILSCKSPKYIGVSARIQNLWIPLATGTA